MNRLDQMVGLYIFTFFEVCNGAELARMRDLEDTGAEPARMGVHMRVSMSLSSALISMLAIYGCD